MTFYDRKFEGYSLFLLIFGVLNLGNHGLGLVFIYLAFKFSKPA